jgi:hypothetical protein
MKYLLRQFFAIFFALLSAASAKATPQVPTKLYAVLFEVTLNASGKVDTLKVSKVIDPNSGSTDAVDIPVPAEYLAAAKTSLLKRTYDPKEKQFFTYTFYDPSRPSQADIDPKAKRQ